MTRYRKILVAFDGSPSSVNALRQALALPEFKDSKMKVLAVVPPFEGDLELVGVRDPKQVMQGQIEALVESAKEIAGPASDRIVAEVEHGRPYEKIVERADDEGCDLVVMGRRGMGRLERMLIGSVTLRVVAHSTRDVLVVPTGDAIVPDEIVVATDGSPHGDAAVEAAMYFAASRGGALTAITVVEMLPEFYADAPQVVDRSEAQAAAVLERVAKNAASTGLRLGTELRRGDPAHEVVSHAESRRAGMVFVGSRGVSGLKKLLLGSVAEKIIGLAHCPVYVAKLKRRPRLRRAS